MLLLSSIGTCAANIREMERRREGAREEGEGRGWDRQGRGKAEAGESHRD